MHSTVEASQIRDGPLHFWEHGGLDLNFVVAILRWKHVRTAFYATALESEPRSSYTNNLIR